MSGERGVEISYLNFFNSKNHGKRDLLPVNHKTVDFIKF